MRIIHNQSNDPYFNLSCEEYLLDHTDDEVFMLWRNSPAVVIGHSQNAYAEVNEEYCRKNNIAVVRRLTGGGAVFHDIGNINYTFIVKRNDENALDFERLCRPIISALAKLGVNAELSGRNDICVDGRKVSGTARLVRQNKIMHHGCLLYEADLSRVAGALNVNEEKMRSKGIKSVRSRVANITEFMREPLSANDFLSFIEKEALADMGAEAGCAEWRPLSSEEIAAIERLRNEKYATWEWNFGKSRDFSVTRTKRFPYGTVTVSYTLNHGNLVNVGFEGDFFENKPSERLAELICGRRFDADLLCGIDAGEYIAGACERDILELFGV